jgi:hypothetical protein
MGAAKLLEAQAETADARKKLYETEPGDPRPK